MRFVIKSSFGHLDWTHVRITQKTTRLRCVVFCVHFDLDGKRGFIWGILTISTAVLVHKSNMDRG